jgi:hypothetical protein
MSIRVRLTRLERRMGAQSPRADSPRVSVWLPFKRRDGRPLGHHPCVGTDALMVIHKPEAARPPREEQA